jgi:hypothetical protein
LPRIGYHASHEQFAPSELLRCRPPAEAPPGWRRRARPTGAGGAAEAADRSRPPAGPARVVPLRARGRGTTGEGEAMTDRQFAAACRRIYGSAADVLEPEAWLAYCRTLRRNIGSAGTSDEERLALIKVAADHVRASRG